MSSLPPPDPVTTEFNPEAWIGPTGILSKLRALYQSYVTYPIAQNYPITFSNLVFVTDAALTKMANTSYIYSALFSAINTWTGLNTFGSIDTNAITTNTITATTLALSGTQLETPMTPIRTYAITPFTPTSGTVNYGTAGTIGYTIVASQNNGNLTVTGISPGGGSGLNVIRVGGYFTGTTISVPPGVWILHLEFVVNVIYGVSIGLSFGTTPLPAGEPQALTTKKAGMFGCQYAAWNNRGVPNDGILSYNQTLCHYRNTTASNVNIYGFLVVNGYGYGGVRATMTAVRIA
jgi:hypothetical protein